MNNNPDTSSRTRDGDGEPYRSPVVAKHSPVEVRGAAVPWDRG